MIQLKLKLFCFSFFILVFCMCGCSMSNREVVSHDESLPSFISVQNVAKCDCLEREVYFALASLGISPCTQLNSFKSADAIRSQLQNAAETIGSELRIISLSDAITQMEQADIGPQPFSIIAHENGHLYGLLGTMDIDGTRLFQLTHGNSSVWLATRIQLEASGFKEVWCMRSKNKDIPIKVGDTELVLDKVYHNFGEIKPQKNVKCTFNIENRGKTKLVLGIPSTSCTCTVSNITEPTPLESGERKELEVVLQPGASTSTRQIIGMKCFDEKSGVSQVFSLELLGNQRRSMRIDPVSLDFGLVTPNEKIERTIIIEEVPTDRFRIKKIEVGNLPMSTKSETNITDDKLNHYRLRFQFSVSKSSDIFQSPGKHQEEITILTDSLLIPKIIIPITFEISPTIRAVPSVLSFGTVKKGKTATSEIEFESREGKKVNVKVLSSPDNVSFEVNDNTYRFTFRAEQSGIWEKEVRVDLSDGYSRVELPIRCVAFVKD